jgi:hypothetical protein
VLVKYFFLFLSTKSGTSARRVLLVNGVNLRMIKEMGQVEPGKGGNPFVQVLGHYIKAIISCGTDVFRNMGTMLLERACSRLEINRKGAKGFNAAMQPGERGCFQVPKILLQFSSTAWAFPCFGPAIVLTSARRHGLTI